MEEEIKKKREVIKGPIRSIFYVHKAIQIELGKIVDLVEKINLNDDFSELEDRIIFLSDVVSAHAKGEEDILYPALDGLRKDISKAFSWDHATDERYFHAMKESLIRIKDNRKQADLGVLKRNIYALNSTLSSHAQKEDDLLVPIVDKEMDFSRQGEMVGKIVAHVPENLMEKMLKWIVSSISLEERPDFIGIIRKGVTPERFNVLKSRIKETLPETEWEELMRQMPELE